MSNIQDTANQALQQMLTMAVNGLQGAVDFSKAQIPDVIHQMLVWNMVTSIIIQIVCLIVIVVFVVVAYKFCKYCDFEEESIWITVIVGLFLIVIPLVVFGKQFDWLEIWLAPKYYLLQQAASLIK